MLLQLYTEHNYIRVTYFLYDLLNVVPTSYIHWLILFTWQCKINYRVIRLLNFLWRRRANCLKLPIAIFNIISVFVDKTANLLIKQFNWRSYYCWWLWNAWLPTHQSIGFPLAQWVQCERECCCSCKSLEKSKIFYSTGFKNRLSIRLYFLCGCSAIIFTFVNLFRNVILR